MLGGFLKVRVTGVGRNYLERMDIVFLGIKFFDVSVLFESLSACIDDEFIHESFNDSSK